MELSQAETEQLEHLIDRTSLYAVIGALEQICYGKAEHLESNWQDTQAAKDWLRVGGKLGPALVAANYLPTR